MCVVGRVPDNRLNCGAQGNFSRKFGGFKTAKFQIQLSKPFGTAFEDDFEKGIDIMSETQGKTATTGDLRYFICVEGKYTNFRFAQNVFEKRPHKIDKDAGEVVDEETANWPVSDELRPDLEEVKYEYQVKPLSVFYNDKPIKVEDVQNVLKGALVEVHFELHHYHIRNKENNIEFDSLNASIEQIIVLQLSNATPTSAYKRKAVGQGPIRMISAAALQNARELDADEADIRGSPSNSSSPLLLGQDGNRTSHKENQTAPVPCSVEDSNEQKSLNDSDDEIRQGKKQKTN